MPSPSSVPLSPTARMTWLMSLRRAMASAAAKPLVLLSLWAQPGVVTIGMLLPVALRWLRMP